MELDHKIIMFRKDLRPMWEEFPEGGSWIIHFKKKETSILNHKWESILFACIGEEFEDENVLGVILSIRERRNLLELWIKDKKEETKLKIGEKLRQVLDLDPDNLTFFFKEHQKSLIEKSTMKGAESYTFVKTPIKTPLQESLHMQQELDSFKLD